MSVLLTLPVAIFIFIENISFGILFILTSTLYSLWAEYVHLHFHKSSDIFLMKFKFFKRLKEHHRIHHYAYNTNYGIGSTIWDVIFSTKKK